MTRLLLLVVITSFFISCKPSNEELISRKWVAVAIDNPELTPERIAETRYFFDTVGKSTSPEVNEQLYGVRNMDSLREILKYQLEGELATQEAIVQHTWMDFHKDGRVAANFGTEKADTVNWYFEEGNLFLDEMKYKGSGSKIKMEVLKLDKETLQIRFNENGFTSTATFKPAE